jgi:hypothetical protein
MFELNTPDMGVPSCGMNIPQKLQAIFGPSPAPAAVPPKPARIEARECDAIDDLVSYIRHDDGYVREAALERAIELASPRLLEAIAERLNDWVPQVRVRAQQAIRGLLPSLDAAAILRTLPAVQHLSRTGRTDHAPWIAEFEQASIRQLGVQAILDGLRSPDARIARACYRLLGTYQLTDPVALVRQVLPHSADILVSRRAVDAIDGMPVAARRGLYGLALSSRYGMLRAIALRKLLTEESGENDAVATRMLIDLQGWVRLIACAYLKKRGVDGAALYAARLHEAQGSSRVLRACLYGLAGLGDTRFIDLVRTFTAHASSRVQASAYLAWLHLEPGKKDEIARAVVASPCRRVRKLALTLVQEHGAYLPSAFVLPVLDAQGDSDLMLAFARREPWAWIEAIVMLEARARTDPQLHQRLAGELYHWLDAPTRSYSRPDARQRALFTRADTLEALHALLGKDANRIRTRLEFELQAI